MEFLANQDFADPDQHFDSSSSSGDGSSDNHSSPAYSASSHQDWALDLGLSMPWSPSVPQLDSATAFVGAAPFKLAPALRSASTRPASAEGQFGLGGDFWNASPGPTDGGGVFSPGGISSAGGGGDYFGNSGGERKTVKQEEDHSDAPMDFEDMVHEGVCGPSLAAASSNPSSTLPTPLASHPFPPPAPRTSATSTSPDLRMLPLSALPPIPRSALPPVPGAGIAPSLTGGSPLASPSVERSASPFSFSRPSMSTRTSVDENMGDGEAGEGETTEADVSLSRSTAASRSGSRTRRAPASRDPSVPRTYSSQSAYPPSTSAASAPLVRGPSVASSSSATNASHYMSTPALPLTAGGSVNLVARDAVQAAELIPSLVSPPARTITSSCSSSSSTTPPLQLLVLGVPTTGAKSRVETQIKISLALVRASPAAGGAGALTKERADGYVVEDGGLDGRAAKELERLGSWTHLRLPKFLALKNRNSKGVAAAAKKPRNEPPPESTLTVDVAVVSATDPSSEVFICANCQQRELKRSLRKKDAKGKAFTAPIPPPDANAPPKNEEEEKRKVVVFNALEFVEFGTGECVLPTRVTCYCRHHKEKKGFCITYSLKDHLGNVVAEGTTPAIMITDDHKTTTAKPGSAAANGDLVGGAAPSTATKASTKRKAAAKPRKEKASSATPTTAGSAPSSASRPSASSSAAVATRPRRSGRSRRGATESDEDLEAVSKKARPYDAEARPSRKRSSITHKSPQFAMTPLDTSNLPPPRPQQLASPIASVVGLPREASASVDGSPTNTSFGSALGLGGMGDAMMSNGEQQQQQDGQQQQQQQEQLASGLTTPSTSFFSSAGRTDSIDLSQAPFDLRAHAMSTPPLSPGSTTNSVSLPPDIFNSLFTGFPSPSSAILDAPSISGSSTIAQQGSFPSFAIPAVEQLPTSLEPNWSLLQQQLQRQQSEPTVVLPRINRIIPGEGPITGGIEVTVLGENFVRDLVCVFGDSPAHPTHFWSSNTLVCVLPPSANPGPVVVGIKGVPLTVEQGSGLQLFTYKDDTDRSLLELALQVVGLKMTGKLENASAIAMRIVGNSPGANGAVLGGGGGGMGGPTDTAQLAATLNAAASSVYATPAASRASSRRSSIDAHGSPTSPSPPLPSMVNPGETRNFQDIVIKFLSLLDLDPSLIPGAAPSLPSISPPISHPNSQRHTLLHHATVLGFHRLVAFLLARDIALDTPDLNGNTALHFAALYGRVAIARLLLDAGASAHLRNRAGSTPLDIAQERDDVDVEELLLARAAAATPTASAYGRRQLAAVSPRQSMRELPFLTSRRTSVVDLEVSEDDYSSDEAQWEKDSAYSSSERWGGSQADDSEWDSSSSDAGEDGDRHPDSGDEADESAVEGAGVPLCHHSRQASRNASTVSLRHLLYAEQEAKEEKLGSPRSRKIALPFDDDKTPPATPAQVTGTPFNHLASASSAWLSQKLKPSVQPSLNKLQPFADNFVDVWEKARANGFTLPQMQLPHMPETLTAFHAMPAALTRRMSTSRRRPAARRAEETGESDEGNESAWERASSFSRDWRAPFNAGNWFKTPSSPPPQYTPRDSLVSGPETDEKESPIASTSASTSTDTAPSPPSATRVPSSSSTSTTAAVLARSRLRRRTSTVSCASDTDSDAFAQEYGKLVGFSGDRMLLLFWLPVLLFALVFAYANWSQYIQPTINTLADTILPGRLARLVT